MASRAEKLQSKQRRIEVAAEARGQRTALLSLAEWCEGRSKRLQNGAGAQSSNVLRDNHCKSEGLLEGATEARRRAKELE